MEIKVMQNYKLIFPTLHNEKYYEENKAQGNDLFSSPRSQIESAANQRC